MIKLDVGPSNESFTSITVKSRGLFRFTSHKTFKIDNGHALNWKFDKLIKRRLFFDWPDVVISAISQLPVASVFTNSEMFAQYAQYPLKILKHSWSR